MMIILNVLSAILAFISAIHAQGDIRRRDGHAVNQIGDWLVVNGGLSSNEEYVLTYDNLTHFIPLRSDWDNSSLSAPSVQRGSFHLVGEALWDLDGLACSFGGQLSPDGSMQRPIYDSNLTDPKNSPAIWCVNPNNLSQGWFQVLGPNATASYPSTILRPANGAWTAIDQVGYYIGGTTSLWNNPLLGNDQYNPQNVPGLLKFDFGRKTLTNTTEGVTYFASLYTGPLSNRTMNKWVHPGYMLAIPEFGEKGILVLLGGYYSSYTGPGTTNLGPGWQNLTIYDIASETFFYQPTNGDIPTNSTAIESACLFHKVDKKLRTAEIFAYGSYRNDTVDQLFVLSLPSFIWHATNYTKSVRRQGMACLSVDFNNQAIMVGGLDPDQKTGSPDNFNATMDPCKQGICVFDAHNLEDKDRYEADAPVYAAPDFIRAQYEDGNRYPSDWVDPKVQAIFEKTWNNPPGNSRQRTRLIVAIGVSSVIALVLMFLTWWRNWLHVRDLLECCTGRRRQQHQEESNEARTNKVMLKKLKQTDAQSTISGETCVEKGLPRGGVIDHDITGTTDM